MIWFYVNVSKYLSIEKFIVNLYKLITYQLSVYNNSDFIKFFYFLHIIKKYIEHFTIIQALSMGSIKFLK